jgi:hypothetical protein
MARRSLAQLDRCLMCLHPHPPRQLGDILPGALGGMRKPPMQPHLMHECRRLPA